MPRFDRTYRLQVGKAGGRGLEIGPPFRITFDVKKDTKEVSNIHKIRIWNLQPATRDALVIPDQFAVLYAGYSEENGPMLLACGTVLFGYTYWEGPDVVTELEIRDGYANVRDTVVSLSYGTGAQARDIIRNLARQMGLNLMMAEDIPNRSWQHGFAFYGAARIALHKIVAGTGLEWSIQDNQLQVIPKGGVTPRTGFVLAASSGLVGYPVRTRAGAREKAKVKDKQSGDNKQIVSAKKQTDGWDVTSLLLPSVVPGDIIKVESRSVDGWFRIDELEHKGDYGGKGDWITELTLVERDAPPAKKPTKGKKKS